jgi:DNA-binding protein YbaB
MTTENQVILLRQDVSQLRAELHDLQNELKLIQITVKSCADIIDIHLNAIETLKDNQDKLLTMIKQKP